MRVPTVLSARDRKAGARRAWIDETWGAHFDHVYYSDHRSPLRNVVHVSRATHYKSNEEKHINFLNRCGGFLAARYEWIFCCDDDTFVFPERLRQFVREEARPDTVYGTVDSFRKCPGNPIFNRVDRELCYPAGGAGYLIPSKVLAGLLPLKNFCNGYSDVSFGLNLRERNVPLVDRDDIFFAQTPEHLGHPADGQPTAISYHYIKTREAVDRLRGHVGASPVREARFRIPLAWWW